jgi:hypothetical protein
VTRPSASGVLGRESGVGATGFLPGWRGGGLVGVGQPEEPGVHVHRIVGTTVVDAIAGLGPGGPSTQTETKAKPEHAQPEIPLKAEPPTEALDKVFAGIPAPAGVERKSTAQRTGEVCDMTHPQEEDGPPVH